jgi:Rad3-related DNA helicase
MRQIYDLVATEMSDLKMYLQSSSMTEKDREDFLSKFQPDPSQTVVGFCVLGGIFSEGIDLKNDRLIGVLVIGVGLPQICLERDIIRNYFQNKYRMGFEYAYVFRGMNKVLQAAGRLIRSERDQGVIVLIDDRFTEKMYVNLFPQDWFPHQKIDVEGISRHIINFWNNTDSTMFK